MKRLRFKIFGRLRWTHGGFDSYQDIYNVLYDYIRKNYKTEILGGLYEGSNNLSHEMAERTVFYRHPSGKYKDLFIGKVKYKVSSRNDSRSYSGGPVLFEFGCNEFGGDSHA